MEGRLNKLYAAVRFRNRNKRSYRNTGLMSCKEVLCSTEIIPRRCNLGAERLSAGEKFNQGQKDPLLRYQRIGTAVR